MFLGLCSLHPQVGKTTFANYLKENYNFISIEMSYAIVQFCTKYLGYNGNKLDSNQREILQDVGYIWKKRYPDIWLYHNLGYLYKNNIYKNYDMSFESYCFFKKYLQENGIEKIFKSIGLNKIVISGIRSIKEVEEIKKFNGKCILIKRNNSNTESIHPVENELLNYTEFDEIIENNSSKEDFYKKIDKLLISKGNTDAK